MSGGSAPGRSIDLASVTGLAVKGGRVVVRSPADAARLREAGAADVER